MNAELPDSDARLARQAYELTADLMTPDARIYWLDLLATSAVTYGALWLAIAGRTPAVALAAGLVAVFALYRGLSFIHELTHLRAHEAPGFKAGWNALIGAPFLAPSLLYEGVHSLHHAKDRYGTARDPEYLPLARGSPWGVLGFVAIAALAPVGQVLRFGVGAPLSLLLPRVRRQVVAGASAMTINPAFRREDAGWGPAWAAQEIGCWLWTWTVAGLALAGVIPWRAVAIVVGVSAAATVVNQMRTACAHDWENDGGRMSFPEQFRDSVNVPPPALAPALWAPVGLRYHALHHLLPRLPYHNLGQAHRRLAAALPATSAYHAVAQRSLTGALAGLVARTRARR